ncbi:hypothetical protein G3I60_05385 [Streptomyces sp. SID13666]|uniref:hypothetical protein n=1 Tax=Streptomyces sp. SID13666 TaxID=2706054 RepID=UPI0013C13D65|nr:hypothetical protein [Streptomyces sp. SID13666]NEA53604.1 hypothetical protein [Streptomyces sp. SID13666]
MTAMTSWAPILAPAITTAGVLVGAWLAYRTNRRTGDNAAMTALAEGFSKLVTMQDQAQDKMARRLSVLESKVDVLEEQQRVDRRWKAAALRYIRDLVRILRGLEHITPPPPSEIAEDLAGPASGD